MEKRNRRGGRKEEGSARGSRNMRGIRKEKGNQERRRRRIKREKRRRNGKDEGAKIYCACGKCERKKM